MSNAKADVHSQTTDGDTTSKSLDPSIWKIVIVVLLGPLMTQLDSTVVNVSLATIQHDLRSSLDTVQWIISGYLLAQAIMLPLNGWLVDRLGAKRLYLGCFFAFTLASVFCGAAKTIDQLIVARLIQGTAGGLLVPMTQLMIARVAGKHMAKVMGYSAMPVLLAPTLGPPLAGMILKFASWPWLFYINLPIGVIALTLAYLLLPNDHDHTEKRPFDLPGFLLISPGLVGLLYGLEHASKHGSSGYLFLLFGVALLIAFAWHSHKKKREALIDLRLFRNSIFTTATTVIFLSSGASFAAQMLLPLYLIKGCSLTPIDAAWILSAMGLGMLCSYPSLGFLTERFGCRHLVVTGVILTILATLPVLWMIHNQFVPSLMIAALILRGVGQGAIGIPSISAGYGAVPKQDLALATTASNIVQRLGGPFATTIAAVVLSSSSEMFPKPESQAFMIPFAVLVALQFVVLGVAWRLPLRLYASDR